MNELIFCAALDGWGVPRPQHEYRFHPERMWRFDFAWPDHKIALEVDGGIWSRGRHVRGRGRLNDMEKFNAAAALGWRIFYVTPEQVYRVATARMIADALRVGCSTPHHHEDPPLQHHIVD